ncbi:MAG: EscU/YscU/HrcU family type III secretion system export apparatus switch protein, partial [Ruminococcus sp.]|nr:EscU/YscU/HrcU family type III secretion system export apparatus switch protein [Ruminococcus sp.]
MAQQGMGGERTEKPTSKHRQDARKDGNIFKSDEIVTLAGLVVVFYSIDLLYPFLFGRVSRIFISEFDLIETTEEMNISNLMVLFIQWLLDVVIVMLPLLFIAAAVSIITTLAQTKGFMSMKPLKPKMEKLNPVKKFGEFFKRIFGPQGWMTTLTSIAKVIVIFWVIYATIKDDIYVFFSLMDVTVPVAVEFAGKMIISIVKNVAIAYLFIVGAD